MMAGKRVRAHCNSTEPARTPASVPHRLYVLLLAVRAVAQVEDELCGLLHAAPSAGELPPDLAAEVADLLDRLPSHELLHDTETLRASLQFAPVKPRRSGTKRSAPKKLATKRKAVEKKLAAPERNTQRTGRSKATAKRLRQR